MLTEELSLFEKIKEELRAKYPSGGYVVIKGTDVAGVWADRMDAIKVGIEKYGNVQFLVKNINDNPEMKLYYTRNLKFINANPHSQTR